jgi:hypothetical protein
MVSMKDQPEELGSMMFSSMKESAVQETPRLTDGCNIRAYLLLPPSGKSSLRFSAKS